LKNIQSGVAKARYKDSKDVYTDLSLVFWNALFYNEAGSQIATDASALKVRPAHISWNLRLNLTFQTVLETEWKKRPVLPAARSSPPPSSAQKVHGDSSVQAKEEPETPAPSTPVGLPANAPVRTITPAHQHNPTSTASTSTSHYTFAKPVPIRPKSVPRQPSPDADVDISPESDGQDDDGAAYQAERDPQSEEIVKQLEKGLPRWPGFGQEGWMNEVHPVRRFIVYEVFTLTYEAGTLFRYCACHQDIQVCGVRWSLLFCSILMNNRG